MSILKALADAELAERALERAKFEEIKAERDAIVKDLHDAFEPQLAEVGELMLHGRDREPVRQVELQNAEQESYLNGEGISVVTGVGYQGGPPLLRLVATARTTKEAATIALLTGPRWGAKQIVEVFPANGPIPLMIESLLALLVKKIV